MAASIGAQKPGPQTKKPRRQRDRAFVPKIKAAELNSGLNNAHYTAVAGAFNRKKHGACLGGKECVVFANANIFTGVKLGAALTHDNAASRNNLTAKGFYAQAFTFGVATVAGTTTCFLVGHDSNPLNR
jgi:hypothetical protein